jgi:nucleoside-diphosphate-sugar epimerase
MSDYTKISCIITGAGGFIGQALVLDQQPNGLTAQSLTSRRLLHYLMTPWYRRLF